MKRNLSKNISIFLAFLLVIIFSFSADGAEVLFVKGAKTDPVLEQQLKVAAQFYGLDVLTWDVGQEETLPAKAMESKKGQIDAIVISADILNESTEILKNLFEDKRFNKISILIADITWETDSDRLEDWSAKAIIKCSKPIAASSVSFQFGSNRRITRQLAGQDINLNISEGYWLNLASMAGVEKIAALKNFESLQPMFLKVPVAGREIFFLTKMRQQTNSTFSDQKKLPMVWQMVPMLMFLRYACGDECWHSVGHFANFTIDDPWLIEPYGHLSYKALLEEMRKADFHTTIAFVPWNFDRSRKDVVDLFKSNPGRFSISIHGNDHDHREFYAGQSFQVQETKIRQSLARMERFNELTGIPYDRVMIFPQGIAPKQAFELLKKYNFMATINSENVPIGENEPTDPLFLLRPMSLKYEDIPSLRRYSPTARSQAEIALQLFLDNPILYYTHHDYFSKKINVFNEIAEMTKAIEPVIQWLSLGQIIKHLYLIRTKDGKNYDVLTFSNEFILKNPNDRPMKYNVRKGISAPSLIRSLKIDGKNQDLRVIQNELIIGVDIPAHQSRRILIEYESNRSVEAVDVLKNNYRASILRWLSDFRDLGLSKIPFGGYLIGSYNFPRDNPHKAIWIIVTIFFIGIVGGWYLSKRSKRR